MAISHLALTCSPSAWPITRWWIFPPDRLLDIAYAQLHKDQGALAEAAQEVDPTAPIVAVLKDIRARHPTVDTLIPTARDELAGLRAFVLDHHIVTIPSNLLP